MKNTSSCACSYTENKRIELKATVDKSLFVIYQVFQRSVKTIRRDLLWKRQ
jgi:hypothetical protein